MLLILMLKVPSGVSFTLKTLKGRGQAAAFDKNENVLLNSHEKKNKKHLTRVSDVADTVSPKIVHYLFS